MSSVQEIEAAIAELPTPEVDELAIWLENLRRQRAVPGSIDNWLNRARGVALSDVTEALGMALTRGDE